MRKLICSFVFLIATLNLVAYADDAPVVDLSDGNGPTTDSAIVNHGPVATATTPAPPTYPATQNLTTEQRLQRLEGQVNYLNQMNLFSKLDELQQQVQQLRGQLEVQEHEIKTLSDQQKNYYQDLNQRIGGAAKATPATATKNNDNKLAADAQTSVEEEQTAYQAAFSALANKKYAEAAGDFKKYLKNYPTGKYAANAIYWLGEVYMAQANTKLAEVQFQQLITKYPLSEKLPDAMLKLAVIHADAGNTQQAIKELKTIQSKFPTSGAARLAALRLKQLGVKN